MNIFKSRATKLIALLEKIMPDQKDKTRASNAKTFRQIVAQANSIKDIQKCMRRGIAFRNSTNDYPRGDDNPFYRRLVQLGANEDDLAEFVKEDEKAVIKHQGY